MAVRFDWGSAMIRQTAHQESFIVRIWQEEGQDGWRAWVQHPRSGESTVVRTVAELTAFFAQWTGKLDDTPQQWLK